MSPENIIQALLLVLVIESLLPALAPHVWKKALSQLAQADAKKVQNVAFVILVVAILALVIL